MDSTTKPVPSSQAASSVGQSCEDMIDLAESTELGLNEARVAARVVDAATRGWSRNTFNIFVKDGEPEEREGYTRGLMGIHKTEEGHYNVTHLESGGNIGSANRLSTAKRFASRAEQMFDEEGRRVVPSNLTSLKYRWQIWSTNNES